MLQCRQKWKTNLLNQILCSLESSQRALTVIASEQPMVNYGLFNLVEMIQKMLMNHALR